MLSFGSEPFPVLRTDRLVLRRPCASDVEALFRMRSDPRVIHYLGRDPMASPEEAVELLEKYAAGNEKGETLNWAITIAGADELIGTIGFFNLQAEHQRAEIGYTLHPAHWRKGIASEAIKAVLQFGARVVRLHSVEARTDPANVPSQRLLARHGFEQEGLLKESYLYKGNYLDTAVWSCLFKNIGT